ncbi:MAG: DUF302 domain-containing protein [Saprospiraceae bacterium]|nr:DUF302 domain-containing protein [Pyrinomonadaceae bacterium]
MPPARLLLFGRPWAGTRILIEVPEAGIALPLKAHVWEAADGGVFVNYSNLSYIADRHILSAVLAAPLFGVFPLLKGALGDTNGTSFSANNHQETKIAATPTSSFLK